MMAGVCKVLKRTLDALELELQVIVYHLMWVLGDELGNKLGHPPPEEQQVFLAAEPFL